ncbi:DJ-1/PfpI family protein [Streptomyces phaeoluteigriseus]|uniref:DJ-1/PfpI family protein n=1 Tax=Streptomyces phaeoluteigriseus TaxID=114686 RepID=A0ABY4Z9K3_9ACTN|nr:DJ-1/PfpI family protein [Streptomyces phaeoluteigriseus]USQ85719.1 DJ-1/PfpI family protein [Streptomyces phaeoluteigriseus]
MLLHEIALALTQAGRFDEAAALFERLVAFHGAPEPTVGNALVLLNSSSLRTLTGRLDEAEQTILNRRCLTDRRRCGMCWYQGMDSKRRVLIVAYDDAQILDIACPSGALDIANRYGAEPPYSVELGTLGRRVARSSAGILMGAGQGLETVAGHLDTLFVVGGIGCEDAASDERLLVQVRRLAGLSRRVASVCTGAYVLAAAGLLGHRRVTTHWARDLSQRQRLWG